MSRIGARFRQLSAERRKGFIPFVTAGDPDIQSSLAICLCLSELGADVLEIGVPFSDPMADGPTIQASSQRALQNNVSVADVLDLVREIREQSDVPIVLFSYFNPILAFGIDAFSSAAADAGVDGLLLTDVIDEEARAISEMLATRGIDLVSLIAPTSSDDRIRNIAESASGFIYAVSRAGVTGAQQEVSNSAQRLVERIRPYTNLPIAVGFGISTAQQIQEVWQYADAAVVGSAIVNEIADSDGGETTVERVDAFVRGLLPKFAERVSQD